MPRTQHGRVGGRRWRRLRDACIANPDNTHCAWPPCRQWVDKALPGTHPWGPTANHPELLCLGGSELGIDEDDLELMHNRCNVQHAAWALARARARGLAPQRQPRPSRALAGAPRTSRTW